LVGLVEIVLSLVGLVEILLSLVGLVEIVLSLVGIVEIVLSLVETFIELYFHDVPPPALLCHKEPARRIQNPLLGFGTK